MYVSMLGICVVFPGPSMLKTPNTDGESRCVCVAGHLYRKHLVQMVAFVVDTRIAEVLVKTQSI